MHLSRVFACHPTPLQTDPRKTTPDRSLRPNSPSPQVTLCRRQQQQPQPQPQQRPTEHLPFAPQPPPPQYTVQLRTLNLLDLTLAPAFFTALR